MVFTFGTLNGVTLTSLVVALVALVFVFFVYLITSRQLRDLKSLERGIDAYALVQEFSQREKSLEKRLIDQKVRLEILELRQSRGQPEPKQAPEESAAEPQFLEVSPKSLQQSTEMQRTLQLVKSELEALRVVEEAGSNGISAKQVQLKIQKSREHTARMMNSFFKEGLVERSEGRPFSYTITDKGRSALIE